MRTPKSWLAQIDKLRLIHAENAAKGKWQLNHNVREKIKIAWGGYHAAVAKPSRCRSAFGKELLARIQNYLGNGGLFNPEMMEHDKVRDLIIDCQDFIRSLNK